MTKKNKLPSQKLARSPRPENVEYSKKVAKYLREFFNEDPLKISAWWVTKNLNLGGSTPRAVAEWSGYRKIWESFALSDTELGNKIDKEAKTELGKKDKK